MRGPKMAMVVAGLALSCGQAGTPSAQAGLSSQGLAGSQALPPREVPSPAQPSSPPRFSADGLYNLANSYARAGKPGLAVLNYERAWLLAPNDEDINANLEYVRASAHVPAEPRARFARFAQVASPALAAWLGVLGVVLVGMGMLARKIAPRFRWLGFGGVFLGITLVSLTISNAVMLWPRLHEAVVLINQTPARVSPVPMGDAAFVLGEAETVTMTAEHEDFVLVRTRGGRSGWVARASLGAVVP
jgi:hypothetical protein